MKEVRSLASVTPYERVSSCDSSAATVDEAAESEAENSCQELLARGTEFLKRGKNGKTRTIVVQSSNLDCDNLQLLKLAHIDQFS